MPLTPIEQFIGIIVGILTILAFSISAYDRLDDLQQIPDGIQEIKQAQNEIKETQERTRRNIEATQAGVVATAFRVSKENNFELDLDQIEEDYGKKDPPEDIRPSDYIEFNDERDQIA